MGLLAAVVALVAVLGLLVVLTFVGERRRTPRWSTAVLAGVFFPVAWTVWYVRDERPFRRIGRRRAASRG